MSKATKKVAKKAPAKKPAPSVTAARPPKVERDGCTTHRHYPDGAVGTIHHVSEAAAIEYAKGVK